MPRSLELPAGAAVIRTFRVGDDVLVSGRALTAREGAHRHLARALDATAREILSGGAIYHCGPIVAQDPATRAWRVVAAGPSASGFAEPWEAEVVARYGVRAVLGKGGMGARTLAALREHGAVYLHAAPGLAVALARHVARVRAVHLLDELGVVEAMWELELAGFPAVVTMDAHGDTLHAVELPLTPGEPSSSARSR